MDEDIITDYINEEQTEGDAEGVRVQHMSMRIKPALTDDEEEDTEALRRLRVCNRRPLRNRIRGALNLEQDVFIKNKYVPDEKDLELLRLLIVRKVCEKSSKWKKFRTRERTEIRNMVLGGIMPNKKNKAKYAVFATTAKQYLSGLKQLLGFIQEEFYEKKLERKLANGRLQLWQYLDFKGNKHLDLPHKIPTDKLRSGNCGKHAFCGYIQLLDSVHDWLMDEEAQEQFFTRRYRRQQDLPDPDMEDEAKKERMQAMTFITNTKNKLKNSKPFGDFNGQINLDKDIKRNYEEVFEGTTKVDPKKAILDYMRDEETKNLFAELARLAREKTVVSPMKMSRLTKELLKRFIAKSPHRQQVFGDCFTKGHFYKARDNGPAAFPYRLLSGARAGQNQTTHTTEDNQPFYVRDPWARDQNDPDDIMPGEDATPEERARWELMSGYCVPIDNHKTCSKYLVYVWFSQFDYLHLLHYEEIAHNFTQARNITWDQSSPFFINSLGEATIKPGCYPLKWNDFAVIAGEKKVTSMYFRHAMSQIMMAQRDQLLAQCEQYTHAHGEQVRESHYTQELTKRAMAVVGHTWYRRLVEPKEHWTRADTSQVYTGEEQARRFLEQELERQKEQLNDYLEMEMRKDSVFVPSKRRFFSNTDRIMVVQSIMLGHGMNITTKGKTMDLLFRGKNPINITNTSVILRLMHIMPKELPCITHLHDSMVAYGRVFADMDLSVRQVEWSWASAVLASIKRLSEVDSLTSPSLKVIFGTIIQEYGYQYCLNNAGIIHQLKFWRAAQEEREARARDPGQIITTAQYIENQNQILGEQVLREQMQQITMEQEEEMEEHQEPGMEEDEVLSDRPVRPVHAFVIEPFEQDMVLEIGDQQINLPKGTPIKWGTKPRNIDDHVKLELLEKYMKFAEDPLVRDPPGKFRSKVKQQLQPIHESHKIKLEDGTFLRIEEYNLDNLATIFASRGFKFQGPGQGLYRVVDNYFEHIQEEPSIDKVRQCSDDIISWVKAKLEESVSKE